MPLSRNLAATSTAGPPCGWPRNRSIESDIANEPICGKTRIGELAVSITRHFNGDGTRHQYQFTRSLPPFPVDFPLNNVEQLAADIPQERLVLEFPPPPIGDVEYVDDLVEVRADLGSADRQPKLK